MAGSVGQRREAGNGRVRLAELRQGDLGDREMGLKGQGLTIGFGGFGASAGGNKVEAKVGGIALIVSRPRVMFKENG
jgi:hypothetical protein